MLWIWRYHVAYLTFYLACSFEWMITFFFVNSIFAFLTVVLFSCHVYTVSLIYLLLCNKIKQNSLCFIQLNGKFRSALNKTDLN